VLKAKRLAKWLGSVLVYRSRLFPILMRQCEREGRRIIVLRYPRAREEAASDPFCFSVTPEVLRQQIKYLKDVYDVKDYADAVAAQRNRDSSRPLAVVTGRPPLDTPKFVSINGAQPA
jgi:hypothetical protein